MKFNIRKYRDGDERTIKRFAFLPTRIDDNTIIWLEWYWIKERYYIGRNGVEWEELQIWINNNNPGK